MNIETFESGLSPRVGLHGSAFVNVQSNSNHYGDIPANGSYISYQLNVPVGTKIEFCADLGLVEANGPNFTGVLIKSTDGTWPGGLSDWVIVPAGSWHTYSWSFTTCLVNEEIRFSGDCVGVDNITWKNVPDAASTFGLLLPLLALALAKKLL